MKACPPPLARAAWLPLLLSLACGAPEPPAKADASAGGCVVSQGIAKGACLIDDVCRSEGEVDASAPCRACLPAVINDAWTSLPEAVMDCGDDGIACTTERCDGKGVCAHDISKAACADKDGPCSEGVCDIDAVKGCKVVPLSTSATCVGADGVGCTVEHCDGQGACEAAGSNDDSACNDALDCTVDSCDPKAGDAKTGCSHKNLDSACNDGNICTADACAGSTGDSVTGCTFITNTADCTDDAIACTVQKCENKACKLAIDAASCLIDGACFAADAAQSGGCQACKPAASQSGWTLQSVGTKCTDDGASCTADTCSASGACQHAAKPGACDDGLPCTLDSCEPASAWADSKTGCAFVDDCPWGHSCDTTAKACITANPVVLVTESATDPAPTNPAAIRVVLDPKTGRSRLWVVYQSQAAAVAKGGKWSIEAPSALRAVVLDPAVASKPGGDKPKPAVLTFANHVSGSGAIAAFPAVAADPESTSQGWLTWLEANPTTDGAPVCIDTAGRGGIPRLARLDGAVVPANGVWTAVAGQVCPLDGGDKPGFMTAGFAVLGGAETDPAKRGGVWARPTVFDLQSPGANELVFSGSVGGIASKGSTLLGEFSTVHPIIIDTGAEDANKARFWALALGEEKSGQTYNRELWALALDATGAKKTTTKWLDSAVTGPGATVLGKVDAVCSLDAAWDGDTGEAVAVIVVRQAGQDRVWVVRGKPGGVFATAQVVAKASKSATCAKGFATARLGLTKGKVLVWMNEILGNGIGLAKYSVVTGTTATPATEMGLSSFATDVSASASPANSLAWRGLGPAMWTGDLVTVVFEGQNSANARVIALHTFKP